MICVGHRRPWFKPWGLPNQFGCLFGFSTRRRVPVQARRLSFRFDLCLEYVIQRRGVFVFNVPPCCWRALENQLPKRGCLSFIRINICIYIYTVCYLGAQDCFHPQDVPEATFPKHSAPRHVLSGSLGCCFRAFFCGTPESQAQLSKCT